MSEFLFAVWTARRFDKPTGDALRVEDVETTEDSTFLIFLDGVQANRTFRSDKLQVFERNHHFFNFFVCLGFECSFNLMFSKESFALCSIV